MALSDNDIELIEKYIDNSLSEDESVLFEEKKLSSKEFVEQLEVATISMEFIKSKNQEKLKKEIEDIYRSSQEMERKSMSVKWYLTVAAAAILLIVSTIVWFSSNSQLSNQELFLSYYEPYRATPITRDETSNTSVAMKYYRSQEYKKALELFLKSDTDEITNLYVGNCYLSLGDNKNAIITFMEGLNAEDIIVKQTARWYLALSNLNAGNDETCYNLLNFIVDNEDLYSNQARKLMKDLKK